MTSKTPQKYELTEPEIVQPLFITGTQIYLDKSGNVGVLSYVDLQSVSERRILSRLIMSTDTANDLYLSLWKTLRKAKPHTPALRKL